MARQKTVFADAAEVAHKWAHQAQSSARFSKGNFYFEGPALYSYGSHFLCGFALIYQGRERDKVRAVLLNATQYSVTTSRHQSMAASASRHLPQYWLPDMTDLRNALETLNGPEGWSPKQIRKMRLEYERAHDQGRDALAALGWTHNRVARAVNEVRAYIKAHHAFLTGGPLAEWRARDADGLRLAILLRDMAGLTDSEITSELRAGHKATEARKAADVKRENARLDREGARLAALSVADLAREYPADGNKRQFTGSSKPYELQRQEEYGRELSRAHKRAKAKGATKRAAAAIWPHVKAYRAWLKGRDDRIIAARRSRLALDVVRWRKGEGTRPEPWHYKATPAIERAIERAARAEFVAKHRADFDAWQMHGAKRPPLNYFEEQSYEWLMIARDIADERATNESAYLAWRADSTMPRPPASAFDYSYDAKDESGATVYHWMVKEGEADGWRERFPFMFAASEIREAEQKEAAAKAEAERQRKVAEAAEAICRWRAGEGSARHEWKDSEGGALLRVYNDSLQTSWGASVPLADAVAVFRFVKMVRARGTSWHANGKRIYVGSYSVDKVMPSGSFKAGCHLINWPEIERAAIAAGVFEQEASDACLVES